MQLVDFEAESNTYKYVKLAESKDKADFAIQSLLTSIQKNIGSHHQKRQCAGIVRNTVNNALEYNVYSNFAKNEIVFKNNQHEQFYQDYIVFKP